MAVLGIIPARYASTRFPGKPLALINGKPMIQHVYERVSQISAVAEAIVATDDERIADTVRQFGGQVMMTSSEHRSGTDRCGEVLRNLGEKALQFDIVINIQGDEPFVDASQLETVIAAFSNPATQIATLKKRIDNLDSLLSPNVVKVIATPNGKAVYFSRQPLPYLRGVEQQRWLESHTFFKHIGIYAFRRQTLSVLVQLQQTPLEKCESLEQLRWLENGYHISVLETTVENLSVDTPEDLKNLLAK